MPAGVDPAAALDDNERFAVVWSVLRALRSHDDRFDAEINKIDLNDTPTDRIIFSGDGLDGQGTPELPFPPLDLPPGAIFAKVVERCGDRKYWETWARDVADIFSRLVHRIEALLASPDNETLRAWFDAFHEELKVSINASISRDNAIEMMAQHTLTRPVFEALPWTSIQDNEAGFERRSPDGPRGARLQRHTPERALGLGPGPALPRGAASCMSPSSSTSSLDSSSVGERRHR